MRDLVGPMRGVGTAALFLLCAAGARAADVLPAPDTGYFWAFTPRAWYLWENDAHHQDWVQQIYDGTPLNGLGLFTQSNKAVDFPFWGGSVSVGPKSGRGPTFTLTALYGTAAALNDGTGFTFLGFPNHIPPIPPLTGLLYSGKVEMSRFDFEGIAQIPVAEGLTATLGGRYIDFERAENGDLFAFDQQQNVTPIATSPAKLSQRTPLLELGFGLTRPATADGRIFAFGNLTGMVGWTFGQDSQDYTVFNVHSRTLSGGVVGVDTNAGVGWRLSDSVTFSARYRLFYLSNPNFRFDTGGTFIHGPEVNATITFK